MYRIIIWKDVEGETVSVLDQRRFDTLPEAALEIEAMKQLTGVITATLAMEERLNLEDWN